MDLSDLRKLVRLMERAELSELEIDDAKEGLRIHMKRGTGQTSSGGAGVAPPVVHVHSTGAAAPAVAHTAPTAGPDAAASGDVIASPMVGTFYRSPSPDSDPFVTPGSRVSEDTVLCIIEAMKVMNEIRSEVEGEILEVLVENGEPVEFGQPLFLIQKG